MSKEAITKSGVEVLRAELQKLKNEDRPRIILAIAEAREHGDLKENAEYHAAREQQGFAEGRIGEIEHRLGNANIIDPLELAGTEKVVFGATVMLVNVADGSEIRYQIVGVDEADIKIGKVSFKSPISRAMIGKELNDQVIVPAPAGEKTFEILKIEYI
ncbi:MAG: transcription elongation factor GreA [Gammaproteobacteria bacterium]|nr:MAG: transcription elongation factor GreA [Gammaproteobacteria bacterium]RLA14709.1 MAG: transcription elongation factor GreA [Gammaproteobacteria bacterium]